MSSAMVTATVGLKGNITLPKSMRDALGLRDGSLVIVQRCGDGVLIRPAVAMPRDTETYSPERRAEFLLNNAVTGADYAWARRESERLGVDPDTIDHIPPATE